MTPAAIEQARRVARVHRRLLLATRREERRGQPERPPADAGAVPLRPSATPQR